MFACRLAESFKKQIIDLSRHSHDSQLTSEFLEPPYHIFCDIEYGKIVAYLIASVEIYNGEQVAFIHSCANKGKQESQKFVYDQFQQWAWSLKLKKAFAITRRNKSICRKFGFKYHAAVIEKDL